MKDCLLSTRERSWPASVARENRDPARLRRPAEIVGERHARVLDLAPIRPPAELKDALVDHANARGAGRMAEGLEATVRVHRQLAGQRERAVPHVLLGFTPLRS